MQTVWWKRNSSGSQRPTRDKDSLDCTDTLNETHIILFDTKPSRWFLFPPSSRNTCCSTDFVTLGRRFKSLIRSLGSWFKSVWHADGCEARSECCRETTDRSLYGDAEASFHRDLSPWQTPQEKKPHEWRLTLFVTPHLMSAAAARSHLLMYWTLSKCWRSHSDAGKCTK